MDRLGEYIKEEFGGRCADYHPRCDRCAAWKAYDELLKIGPLTDEESSFAMHWLDRYISGIDDYPQFDRIINRRALAGRM